MNRLVSLRTVSVARQAGQRFYSSAAHGDAEATKAHATSK